MSIDLLAIGAHPDDAEIATGGLLLRSKAEGYRTGILHLTRGEMASRGDPVTRRREAEDAAAALGLDACEFLDFGDCRVEDDFDSRAQVAEVLRRLRPAVVLAPHWDGVPGQHLAHTDHVTAGRLVSHAVNFASLAKMPVDGEPHRVEQVFYYFLPPDVKATFVVDFTEYADRYADAIKCYQTQFIDTTGAETELVGLVLGAVKEQGSLIRSGWGHAFLAAAPLPLPDPLALTRRGHALAGASVR